MSNINATTRGGYVPGTEPFRPGYQSLPEATKLQAMIHAHESGGSMELGNGQALLVSPQFGTNRNLMMAIRDCLPQNYGIAERFLASVGSDTEQNVPVGVLVRAKGPGILPEFWMAFDSSGVLLAEQKIPSRAVMNSIRTNLG